MTTFGRRSIPDTESWGDSTPSQSVRRQYQLRLVTPMVGGGAQAGQTDTHLPIRPSGVRGHLRFWWRMMHRHKFVSEDGQLDVIGMRAREAEMWGSTEVPSAVQMRVQASELTNDHYLAGERFGFDQQSPEAYALFSAIEGKIPRIVKPGWEFRLELHWPTLDELNRLRAIENKQRSVAKRLPAAVDPIDADVDLTVATWIAFGGIGARTRRGLGTIEDVDGTTGLVSQLPVGANLFLLERPADPMFAWRQAVEVYQKFRQSFRGAKHKKIFPGGNSGDPPGRSHWPEPDSIRMLTDCALDDGLDPGTGPHDVNTHNHATPIVTQNVANFPRAVLGLPIGFHFADGPGKGKPADRVKDPASVELVPRAIEADGSLAYEQGDNGIPVAGDRMASPIITKAMQLDGQWHAAVLVLPYEHALQVNALLKGTQARWNASSNAAEDLLEEIPNTQIVGSHLSGLCPTTMSDPMRGHGNAIEAFKSFLGQTEDGATPPERKPAFVPRSFP